MTSKSEWFGDQPRAGARPDDTVILNEGPGGSVAVPDGADATVPLPMSSETAIIPAARQAPPEERIETPPPPRKRRRWLVAAGVVALLGAGAAGTAAYVTVMVLVEGRQSSSGTR